MGMKLFGCDYLLFLSFIFPCMQPQQFEDEVRNYFEIVHIDDTIEEQILKNSQVIPLDLTVMSRTNQEVFKIIINDPSKIKVMSHIINEKIKTKYPEIYEKYNKEPTNNMSFEITAQIRSVCSPVFYNNPVVHSIRDLKSSRLNKITTIAATVTRTSTVRPELYIAHFMCLDCHTTTYSLQENTFKLPPTCRNTLCKNRTKFKIDMKNCFFNDWQKIICQEITNESTIPRTLNMYARNYLVERIKPGDNVRATGELIVIADYAKVEGKGRGMDRRDVGTVEYNFGFMLNYIDNDVEEDLGKLSLDSKKIVIDEFKETNDKESKCEDNTNDFDKENLDANINDQVKQNNYLIGPGKFNITANIENFVMYVKNTPNLYQKLSDSLFPYIYGHQNIKRAILLLLAQGNTKKNKTNTLRGDINILLVGDPGTAKSQFLKTTATILPRSIYTSGKSASAAGLTACVVKDVEGEFSIEAGALMLSDNSVCCIDEFDKMDRNDRVSIHEAMEQGTVTINKAGINATLNARCSVLAAANPINGTYDEMRSLKANINLSEAIMSRFDLYFVLIDHVDKENDGEIAKQIIKNHTFSVDEYTDQTYEVENTVNSEVDLKNNLFSTEEMREYLQYIRKNIFPKLTPQVGALIVEKYTKLRRDSLINTQNYKITVRQLESLIRISEALAKIHCDEFVRPEYVEEAYRLIQTSVIEVRTQDINLNIDTLGGGTELQQDSKISINRKDYTRILNSFIYILKKKEINFDDLIGEYLMLREAFIDNEETFNFEETHSKAVLDYLLKKEGVFYEIDGIIKIHPNYDA